MCCSQVVQEFAVKNVADSADLAAEEVIRVPRLWQAAYHGRQPVAT